MNLRRLTLQSRGLARSAGSACFYFLSLAATLACDTREIALRTVSFNSCGTPWEWDSALDIGDLYSCDGSECGPDTVLRVTRVEMNEDDKLLDHEALLADWTERVIPAEMNGYKFEMITPISTETFGAEDGIFIPLKVTNSDGDLFNSLAFRVPLDGFYLVVNATGATETGKLRGFLQTAVENMTIAKEHRP
jgi:hypothetical protein